MGPGRAWLAVGLRPGAVLWTAALATLATMVGFLFCLLPGVLAAIGFALAMPIGISDPAGMISLASGWSFAGLQLLQLAISLLVFPLPVIGTTLVYLHARREQENVPLAELQLQMQRAAMDR